MTQITGVITDLEPNILECEVKWALESIIESEVKWALGSLAMSKDSGGDRIPAELF